MDDSELRTNAIGLGHHANLALGKHENDDYAFSWSQKAIGSLEVIDAHDY